MWTLLSGVQTSPAACSHQTILHLAEILVFQAGWAREKARLSLGSRDAVELPKPLLAVLVLLEKPEK